MYEISILQSDGSLISEKFEKQIDLIRKYGVVERSVRNSLRSGNFIKGRDITYRVTEVEDDLLSKQEEIDNIIEKQSLSYESNKEYTIKKDKVANYIKDKDCYKCLLIADLHFDHQDDSVLSIIKQVYKDNIQTIDEICYLGDEIDLNSVSKFKTIVKNKENPIKQLNMFVDFSSYFDVPQIRLGSNHIDERLSKYVELHPELESIFEDFKNKLDYNIHKTTEYGEYYFPFQQFGNDIIRLTHGKYLSAKAYSEKSKVDTIIAHIHTMQVHTSPLKTIAYSIPCACKINPKYTMGLETSWNQGFAILNYYPKLHQYNVEYIIVKEGKAIYRDKIYTSQEGINDCTKNTME